MPPITVLFAPGIDAALVETLSTFPEAGPFFQGEVRMFPVEGYVFLCEHYTSRGEVHVLDMIAPGRHWRFADRR